MIDPAVPVASWSTIVTTATAAGVRAIFSFVTIVPDTAEEAATAAPAGARAASRTDARRSDSIRRMRQTLWETG